MSTPILLVTLNAKYQHSAFGLRYLYANLQEFQKCTKILEFTVGQDARDIVENILLHRPQVVGFGIYIWNTRLSYDVISILKKMNPNLVIVLGGPEVSYEMDSQAICNLADFTILGEADLLFYDFCKSYFSESKLPTQKWIRGELPNIATLVLPYDWYSEEDIKNRVIYVEASRGCPYKCEYCLSSLDKSVRNFDLDQFLLNMDSLIHRGARQFKFVDRTFNLSVATSSKILQFFLDRVSFGLFLHFEMVPDRLPLQIRELIQKFPLGSLQFEVGIQTWSVEVAKLVSRRQDYSKIQENFKFLTLETSVHIHADLIVGLPGETLESFAEGFDQVSALNAHEIQVGMLKRLKGTPIVRHDKNFEMVYQEHPPFQILSTKTMDFKTIQDLNRFAQFWDLYVNSGKFKNTMKCLLETSQSPERKSVFWEFYKFAEFLSIRHPQRSGISLIHLVESAWVYFKKNPIVPLEIAKSSLIQDYTGYIKRDIPPFLRDENCKSDSKNLRKGVQGYSSFVPKRQAHHIGARTV